MAQRLQCTDRDYGTSLGRVIPHGTRMALGWHFPLGCMAPEENVQEEMTSLVEDEGRRQRADDEAALVERAPVDDPLIVAGGAAPPRARGAAAAAAAAEAEPPREGGAQRELVCGNVRC